MKSISFSTIIFLFLAGCGLEQELIDVNPWIIQEGERPWIIAHGGAKDLWPENTMMAMRGSADLGVDVLEMDIGMTADEILVLQHDATIDRLSDGTGAVIDFTFEELLEYNFGANFEALDGTYPYQDTLIPIPTLEEIFLEFPDYYMVVEIKNSGEDGLRAAELLHDLIVEYQMQDRVLMASFHDEVVEHFLTLMENDPMVSTPRQGATRFIVISKLRLSAFHRPKAIATQLPLEEIGIRLNTKRVVNSAHRHNMAIHYWTINEKETMRELLELGADGLITDRPDLMMEVLQEMGFSN
ncbi:MAG TPA: glycerophosphodiester phosphodiesterase [Cytophagales bacterium]|nr:glycerophosphodiester phosphodiesterase [Cytophagales bacterium]HAA18495.1 glycerophosphodiester phosphodiesterase [Cytophagales bacterium]HAP58504.1 glycerophosphodiester phosphodiesterase [Cytophagales bacterium]